MVFGGGGGVGTAGSESLSVSELMALATELSEEQLDDDLELEMGLSGSLSLRDESLSFFPNELLSCFPDESLSPFELLWDLEGFEGFGASTNSSLAGFLAFFGTEVLTGGSIFFDETFSPFPGDDFEDDFELDDFELVALTIDSGVEGDFDLDDDLEDFEDFSDFSDFSFGGFSLFSLVWEPFLPETVLPCEEVELLLLAGI